MNRKLNAVEHLKRLGFDAQKNKQLLKLLFTGKVWLGVLSGHTQPPVFVAVDRPFNIVNGK